MVVSSIKAIAVRGVTEHPSSVMAICYVLHGRTTDNLGTSVISMSEWAGAQIHLMQMLHLRQLSEHDTNGIDSFLRGACGNSGAPLNREEHTQRITATLKAILTHALERGMVIIPYPEIYMQQKPVPALAHWGPYIAVAGFGKLDPERAHLGYYRTSNSDDGVVRLVCYASCGFSVSGTTMRTPFASSSVAVSERYPQSYAILGDLPRHRVLAHLLGGAGV